jgi:hypothetical protein
MSESFIGKIYKISSCETDKIYIGSTKLNLNERLKEHKKDYKAFIKGNGRYISSCELVKFSNVEIELIHEGLFSSKEELLKLEGSFIRQNSNCVNKQIAGRTKQQYHEDNKEKLNNMSRIYRQEHKEEIINKNKEYYENHKEEISVKRKEYYINNKEERNKKNKEYYENNKDKLNEHCREKGKEKITCETCKIDLRKDGWSKHCKTKNHIEKLNLNTTTTEP